LEELQKHNVDVNHLPLKPVKLSAKS
jgi:hypothetical protein